MLRLAFDFIITWRETRTRPNAYTLTVLGFEMGRGIKRFFLEASFFYLSLFR